MQTDISTAVILAAGCGTRLGSTGQQMPKGFLRFGELPIVEESVLRLRSVGCQSVVIVTGHLAEWYINLQAKYPALIQIVHNEYYADSGSMYSLWCARDSVHTDFLLLESDLIYEPKALTACLRAPHTDTVLMSSATGAGDEVFIEVDQGKLVAMSKNAADLAGEPAGEFVGISRLSHLTYRRMLALSDDWFRQSRHVAYETDGLVQIAQERRIHCLLFDSLAWTEIDDEGHFRRAAETIYPVVADRDREWFQSLDPSSIPDRS